MKLKCGWCEKEVDSHDDKEHKVEIKMGITTIIHRDKLLTPDDWIIKLRLARKYRRIMTKIEHDKKLKRLELPIDQLPG